MRINFNCHLAPTVAPNSLSPIAPFLTSWCHVVIVQPKVSIRVDGATELSLCGGRSATDLSSGTSRTFAATVSDWFILESNSVAPSTWIETCGWSEIVTRGRPRTAFYRRSIPGNRRDSVNVLMLYLPCPSLCRLSYTGRIPSAHHEIKSLRITFPV